MKEFASIIRNSTMVTPSIGKVRLRMDWRYVQNILLAEVLVFGEPGPQSCRRTRNPSEPGATLFDRLIDQRIGVHAAYALHAHLGSAERISEPAYGHAAR